MNVVGSVFTHRNLVHAIAGATVSETNKIYFYRPPMHQRMNLIPALYTCNSDTHVGTNTSAKTKYLSLHSFSLFLRLQVKKGVYGKSDWPTSSQYLLTVTLSLVKLGHTIP